MTNFQLMKLGLSKMMGRKGLLLKKWAPEIMIFAGTVGIGYAAIDLYKANLKASEVIEEAREDFAVIKEAREKANEERYPETEHKKDIAKVYVKSGKSFLKLYGRGIAVGLASIGLIFGGDKILRGRNMVIMAAYTALEQGYNAYRNRVVEEYGAEKDSQFTTGTRYEAVVIEETDETGKKKKIKKTMELIDHAVPSQYGRWFDEVSREWVKTPEFNLVFLLKTQEHVNDLLVARKHVFLNEVYDRLGFERTGAGAVVGWVFGDKGMDNHIDFGIFHERNSRFLDGLERNCFLDFNVDGVIYQLI